MASTPGFGSLPVYVAQTQGFFRRNGLNVKITEGLAQPTYMEGLGKQWDIVNTTPATFLAAVDAGLNLVQFASLRVDGKGLPPASALYVKSPSIKTISDLKGKRIGVTGLTGAPGIAIKILLSQAGILNTTSLVVMDTSVMSDQLKAGAVDGVVTFSPFDVQLKSDGDHFLGDPQALAITALTKGKYTRWQGSGETTTRAFATKNPKILAEFRTSLAEAIQWCLKNTSAARSVAEKWLGLPAAVISQVPIPDWTTTITPAQLEPYIALLHAGGALKTSLSANNLVVGQ